MNVNSNKENALRYYKLGFNISCISYLKTEFSVNEKNPEKSPSHSWKDLQVRRQNIAEIEKFPWEYSTGIGAVLGDTGYLCIDIDNCVDYEVIKNVLETLFLPENYEWVVKTPNGFHIYVKTTKLNLPKGINKDGIICVKPNEKNKNKFQRVEFRFAGHAVLPFSIIEGKFYFFFVKNDYGRIQSDTFPANPPKQVSSIIVFSLMAYLSGDYRKEYGHAFLADFNIGGYDFKFSLSSSGPNFEINQQNQKIYEVNFSQNHITSPKKIESILFLNLEFDKEIKDQLNYSNYPRLTKLSYVIETYEQTVNGIYSYNTSQKSNEKHYEVTTQNHQFLDINSEVNNLIDILEHLSTIIDQKITMVVIHDMDLKLAILDSEYLRLKKRNPLRDKKIICIKHFYQTYNVSKELSLDDIHSYFFSNSIIKENDDNNGTEIKKLFFCYKIMELYGYFNSIPMTIVNQSY